MVSSVNEDRKRSPPVPFVNTRNVLKVQAATRIDKLNEKNSFKSFLATSAGQPCCAQASVTRHYAITLSTLQIACKSLCGKQIMSFCECQFEL